MRGRARDDGQSSIEFALIVPVVFTLLLFAAQLGVLIVGQVAVTRAAHEVARSVSVDPTSDPVAIAARTVLFGEASPTVVVDRTASSVAERELISVTVTSEVPRLAPLRWAFPRTVSGHAVTLSEH